MTLRQVLIISVFSILNNLISFGDAGAQTPPSLNCAASPELDQLAHQFMEDKQLIANMEEEWPAIGRSTKWTLVKTDIVDGNCLLLMEICAVYEETSARYCDREAFEVLGYQQGRVTFFEHLIPVPEKLRVAIGKGIGKDDQGKLIFLDEPPYHYYLELEGASALSAAKTIAMIIPYSGLSAQISAREHKNEADGKIIAKPDGKESFDPNQNRTWKLKNAKWDLKRGLTVELADVYSEQIDSDFSGYYLGSAGTIAPWRSYLLQVYDPQGQTWKETGIRGKIIEVGM